MKQQLLFLFFALSISIASFSQLANQPTPLEQCDDEIEDGLTPFDLTVKEPEILGNQNPSNLFVSYFLTQAEADNAISPLINVTSFTNYTNPQTLYVRVEDGNTGNFDTVQLTLIVLNRPTSGVPADLLVCDQESPSDMVSIFDLTTNAMIIQNGEANTFVTFHTSTSDAISGSNIISNPTAFFNTSSPQTIYARVENTITGCFGITSFDIIVSGLSVLNFENEYTFCNGETFLLDTELNDSEYAFEWSFNGNLIPSESGSTLSVSQSGTYSVVATNLDGCGAITAESLVEMVDCSDSDDDGVIDSDEDLNGNGNLDDDDTDMDSIPNYLDDDDDGDNVDTIIEINIPTGRSAMHSFVDTDLDTVENYLDDDDDGDGVLTEDEDYNENGDPTDDDTDMSGTADYLESNVALNVVELLNDDFKMFPNPVNYILTLNFGATFTGNLSIYDLQGKTIFRNSFLNRSSIQLDVATFESGLYFVKFNTGSNEITRKLIID